MSRGALLIWSALLVSASGGCGWAADAVAGTDSEFGTPRTAEGQVRAFLKARRDGHLGEEFWREVRFDFPKIGYEVPIEPTSWERVLSEDDDDWSWFRYRIESTNRDGVPLRKLWDFCVARTFVGPRVVAAWPANDATVRPCSRNDEWPAFQYPHPKTKEEFDRLPLDAYYVAPSGHEGRKTDGSVFP